MIMNYDVKRLWIMMILNIMNYDEWIMNNDIKSLWIMMLNDYELWIMILNHYELWC